MQPKRPPTYFFLLLCTPLYATLVFLIPRISANIVNLRSSMTLDLHVSQAQRLQLVICISLCFFIAEISVGFYTRSLALVADAFHYVRKAAIASSSSICFVDYFQLNDLVGFMVAFASVKVSN